MGDLRIAVPLFAASLAGCVVGWSGVSSPLTYPLIGAHATLACADCHPAGAEIAAVPSDCADCHEAARPTAHYEGDCGACHTPVAWSDVVVDHDFFPLADAHELECDSCHAAGTFEGLVATCTSCHEAARPASHFPGDCGECHVPTTWDDATFDHDSYFPLPHQGVSECESCHLTEGVYTDPSCTSCHAHGQGQTNNDHDEVPNYQYTDQACIRCHPDGRS